MGSGAREQRVLHVTCPIKPPLRTNPHHHRLQDEHFLTYRFSDYDHLVQIAKNAETKSMQKIQAQAWDGTLSHKVLFLFLRDIVEIRNLV